jgi:hypothetical protein
VRANFKFVLCGFHLPCPLYFLSGLLFFECTPLFLRLGFGCHKAVAFVVFAFAIVAIFYERSSVLPTAQSKH